jgi:glycosyltransferase involved in cell wall biosynthesis
MSLNEWRGQRNVEFIIDDIKSIDIYIYSAHKIVIEKIFEFNEKYNLNIEYSSRYNQLTHSELLEKFGQAKIAIGNNISDGVPNTLLEAIICGAFPIQSNPGGASEDYIVHNKNGLLIKNPEDSKEIAKQIKKALINDELLKNAFSINQEIAKKLDHNLIKKEVLKAYKQIEADV